jgi:hypothetical protein
MYRQDPSPYIHPHTNVAVHAIVPIPVHSSKPIPTTNPVVIDKKINFKAAMILVPMYNLLNSANTSPT